MKKRRLLAWVLTLAMMVSSISVTSFAEEAEAEAAAEEVVSGSAVEVSDEAVEADETEESAADTDDSAIETEEAESADLLTTSGVYQSGEQFVTAGDWSAATFGNSCDDTNIVTTDSDGNTAYKNWVNAASESTVTMHAEKAKSATVLLQQTRKVL
ncbi:MAG: hypothetical protein LUC97_09505 [Clostridiales bacterium]|nr:hypothetical protein [Clostridiales bacterium]